MAQKPYVQPPMPEGIERKYMRVREAAAYLCLSATKLKTLRANGRGPAFRRVGHTILYSIADMDAWVTSLNADNATFKKRVA